MYIPSVLVLTRDADAGDGGQLAAKLWGQLAEQQLLTTVHVLSPSPSSLSCPDVLWFMSSSGPNNALFSDMSNY